ncbi:four-carbon acid sugar kinase family protein [Paenibacillus sp. MMS20-IR301]|uniref:four-carbon acid sugar kinase family protein n=1 Tax=Paenibacillus sp. MMS20-IR301 TaxID=2895946 RepID=UPI0028E443C8|nr:four-carbon acid sugar kinase family protein [Paenibacillus sp. MMS20-IR301]WNS46661.1 four-carbon acid sugar kinase family protein [Paenibacillus sp. MMS20-IR301]
METGMEKLQLSELQQRYAEPPDLEQLEAALSGALQQNPGKIIVLDDDPTGVQTVHGVTVITDWEIGSIRQGFLTPEKIFFILTNSRSFTRAETEAVHREIASNIIAVSRELNRDYILVSRGDSTLRGHYPLETEVLRHTLEGSGEDSFDGEILCPFFKEGGRFTADNIHYVSDQGGLTPCGETEFARDRTFGYKASELGQWVEEQTAGAFPRDSVTMISLEELRSGGTAAIAGKLKAVTGFNKVVVNALDYCDLTVFCTALYAALAEGKRYLYRTAASFVRVLGGVSAAPLLTAAQLPGPPGGRGGLIVAGSHTAKTTAQLEQLGLSGAAVMLEFNQHLLIEPEEIAEREIQRVIQECTRLLEQNKTVALCTRRERLDLNSGNKEDELRIAVRISDALTGIVASLPVSPRFIIAKGGITSSDIGTKALMVRQAVVAGQIKPGIPVWICGEESRFPQLPYVIFPGNVGEETTLREIVEELNPCGK